MAPRRFALLLDPRAWIVPYVALWFGVGLLPFQPTDLDIFFWPSAKIAAQGHPLLVYSAGGHALYPNANGPVALLPLSLVAVVLNLVGWLDATTQRRAIAMGVFCLFILLMAREAVLTIERLRGARLNPSRRLLAYSILTLNTLAWQSVAGYGHIEQPIEIWLLLLAARWVDKRPLNAGLAFGLAIMTRSSAVLMAVPLGLAGVRRGLRGAIAFFAAAAGAVAAILAPFLLADPDEVVHSLFTYRGSLQVGAGSVWSLTRGSQLESVVQHWDIVVVVAAVAATNLWLARGGGLEGGRLLAAMTLTSATFAMLAKTVWPYYFFEVFTLGFVWAAGTWRSADGVVRLVLLPVAVAIYGLLAEVGSEQHLPLDLVRIEGTSVFVMLALTIAWVMWFARREAPPPAGIAPATVRLKGHGPGRADESTG
ncbi:MAG TPA: hypothetical protein VFL29_07535 [Candidatus Dormibacteraeota bacterium]|nr:hypothetical protein [Candidatus Dormibacteraeota bacterium]